MEIAQNWWESSEITDIDVVIFVNVFNDCVCRIDPFKYRIKLKDEDIHITTWYKDMVNLVRLVFSLKAIPREYIYAQISEYKKPMKKARAIPTLRMMTSPSGVDRYNSYLKKMGRFYNNQIIKKITSAELIDFSEAQMKSIMSRNNIQSEEIFFQDIYLINQLSKDFVLNHPVFKKLCEEKYYFTEFGLDPLELFV